MPVPMFASTPEVVAAYKEWPDTTAEPLQATVTIYPHRLVTYSDGVRRGMIVDGQVQVIDFYRGRP